MKKTTLSLAFLALAMGLNSCSNENENEVAAPKCITVSTEIGSMTRVATDANGAQTFVNGDQISVYAWTGDATTAPGEGRVVDNSINTYDGKSWTANPQMLWKNTNDKHYFIALYPKTETSVSDLENFDYTLDTSNQEKSDLLVATNLTGLTSSDNPVPLNFSHVMAKVQVGLSFRNQWGTTPTVESVTLKDAKTAAKVNCLTKEVTASTPANLNLPKVTQNTLYSSIVVPQTDVQSIIIRIGSKDYKYNNPDGIRFESGKITRVDLIVGRDEITLGTVSIDDWADGSVISDGEAQE